MFGASIGRAAQRIIDAIVRWLAIGHINPNILTVIGVALNVVPRTGHPMGLQNPEGLAQTIAEVIPASWGR